MVSRADSERRRFVAQFDIHVAAAQPAPSDAPKEVLGTSARAHYLRSESAIQAGSPVVKKVLEQLADGKATKGGLLERIFEYCSDQIAHGMSSDAVTTLQSGAGSTVGRARAMVALCRAGRIPARLAAGFVLDSGQEQRPHVWMEARVAKQWLPYDPESGYARELPPTHLLVRRDGCRVVRTPPGAGVASSFPIRSLTPPPAFVGSRRDGFLAIVDLMRLPLGMQNTLSILLLLPVGALITSFFRNIIGVQTFGTFTPTLLALSFVYADWRTGLVVFVVVTVMGLAGRSLLERLRLLMVPRLSLILTFIVLTTVVAVSALDYFGLTPSARAVLFPMVILTMMIERFHIRAEEDGLGASLRLLVTTLVVAMCCFLLLRSEELGRVALASPEGLFFVAAALVLVGRYSGYRLVELWRFRDLARAEPTDETK